MWTRRWGPSRGVFTCMTRAAVAVVAGVLVAGVLVAGAAADADHSQRSPAVAVGQAWYGLWRKHPVVTSSSGGRVVLAARRGLDDRSCRGCARKRKSKATLNADIDYQGGTCE